MKKYFNKENIIALFSYIVTFLIILLIITHKTNSFASTTDFDSQHFLIPEYFRNLFYQTHDLLPDFAMNLSGGVNIYYLSYYGLLSPIILLSYLMPNVPMYLYVIVSTSIITVISSFCLYLYLRKNNYSFLISLLGGYLFLLASPLIFHTHRHIMFVNYMFFLVMGMFGVDKYFEKKKPLLLIISVFLIVMTSYYYSVGAIASLFVLGIYKYLKKQKHTSLKAFFKWAIKFSIPFIIGVMLGAIIILPSLYVIVNSRGEGGTKLNLLSLLIPNLSFKYILYSPYSAGCSLISLIACFYYLLKDKKELKFLSIIILLIGSFPLFNYLLNGTLYIDAKSLIPFLPLIIIVTVNFINELLKKKISSKKLITILYIIMALSFVQILINLIFNNKETGLILKLDTYGYSCILIIETYLFIILTCFYLYKKKNIIYILYLFIVPFIFSLIVNFSDPLMKKNEIKGNNDEAASAINKIVSSDSSIYRINNGISKSGYNQIFNIKQLQSTIYSSTNNKSYNLIYYNAFKNNMSHRNRSMIGNSSNRLFSMFMGEKYFLSADKLNYDILEKKSNFTIYQNNNTMPIGYVNSNLMNTSDFNKLNYPSQQLSLLNSVVLTSNKTNYKALNIAKIIPEYEIMEKLNLIIKDQDNMKKIISNNGSLKIKLEEKYSEGILFINFKNNNNPSCNSNDLSITINNQKNKLTCYNWKYHNRNYTFYYSLESSDILNISFSNGDFLLSDFELYFLSNSLLNNVVKEVTPFNIDKIEGDEIKGNINVQKSGYFVIQIPYDKGFKITVDNQKQDYEMVNNGVIGFPLKKGMHDIKIIYEAPFKKTSIIISIGGLICVCGYLIIIKRTKYDIIGIGE